MSLYPDSRGVQIEHQYLSKQNMLAILPCR